MSIVNLSADFCRKAICPEDKNKIDYRDKTIKGFILEVRSSGNKTYALRYRDKHNRQCQYKIGNYGDMTFEKARRAAEHARSQVVLGIDPAGDKRVKRRVPTLSYFTQFHYLPHIKQYKRSWKADQSMLRTHILPKFRTQHMDKITSQAVSDFHHGLVSKGLAKGTANRGLVLLKAMFNRAIKWEIPGVTVNPATEVKLFNANNARIAAGLPDVRMHDLRHSMASNMLNSGRSIYEVAKVLGHSQLKTTQRYAHLSQETLLEAVDAAANATGMI